MMVYSEISHEPVTEVHTEAPASEGFVGRFGLDPWLLLAQAVNFLIVLFVLSRFVFRPLLATIRSRRQDIEKGLNDAEAATIARQSAEEGKRWLLDAAAREAAQARRRAEEEAAHLRQQIVRDAEDQAETMHDRAERDAEQLKTDALHSVGVEAGDMVVDALERVLAVTLTPRERERYREAALRALKQQAS